MVDYDWPIGGGQNTPSSFLDQLRVMDQISILTGGRIHSFVPFDPMKEVAYGLRASTTSSFALVQEALLNPHSAIGVKLYPPMGFAPSGNAQYDPDGWNYPWIPPQLRLSDLGRRMDAVLNQFFGFCRQYDVPVMAHTAPSNAPAAAYYDKFLRIDAWGGIPAGTRVNFGHFGDTRGVTDRALALARWISEGPGTQGEFFYADSGYFVEALDDPSSLRIQLANLFDVTRQKGEAALAQRLMYGTDWEMIIVEGRKGEQYLAQFEAIFSALDSMNSGSIGRLSDRFFGINAAKFLGLSSRPLQYGRQRVERFYAANNIVRPSWMSKVDDIKV